jgi:hypothetical protein
MPDGSVDLVLTSPPFLALRSYLPADHPDKAKEIGQEPTPSEFLDTLLALTAEWGRVLAPHGSIAVELGDTYSGTAADGWPLEKSLCMVPELYAASLAYGRNLLSGEVSPAGEWRVRNGVKWVRSNPPVGALGDKFRPASSLLTVACKAKDRWFDLDAVRELNARSDEVHGVSPNRAYGNPGTGGDNGNAGKPIIQNPNGAPPLDWWEVSPEAYKGSHYATWPQKLLVRPVLSMCPQHVCRTCGEPRRRIDGDVWTDCDHDDYRRGIVLDPFAGSGTTLAVANGLGRDAVGIDLDARNADLARERVGMFLDVVEPEVAT